MAENQTSLMKSARADSNTMMTLTASAWSWESGGLCHLKQRAKKQSPKACSNLRSVMFRSSYMMAVHTSLERNKPQWIAENMFAQWIAGNMLVRKGSEGASSC